MFTRVLVCTASKLSRLKAIVVGFLLRKVVPFLAVSVEITTTKNFEELMPGEESEGKNAQQPF